jgi:thiamine pyrophosphokinase
MVPAMSAPFFLYNMTRIVRVSPVYRYYELKLTEEQEKIYKENPNEFLIDIVKDEDWVYIESTVGADEYELKK